MKRICVVVATDATIKAFLIDQLRELGRRYRVTVVANTRDARALDGLDLQAELVPVGIERPIRPLRDLAALTTLWRLLRSGGFVAVHSVTPKAGLLAMLAGAVAGVPVRIHMFTGQVWATRTGLARWILKQADRAIAGAATVVLADSWSQRAFLVDEGVVAASKIGVLGAGSISGVDLQRFRPDEEARRRHRSELGLPERAVLFLFLGRLNRDKGVLDLAAAFGAVAMRFPDAHLAVVGPDEEGLASQVMSAVGPAVDRVRVVGFTSRPEALMAAADVFCMPSYREGFGSAVIEAAAVGLPAIASRIYGLTDSVEEGVTGLLHPAGDVAALAALMERLAAQPELRVTMGREARRRAEREFGKERLTQEVLRLYQQRLPPSG
jgi:glycosyltransferase involved in cell wall biosynthesis